MSLAEPLAAPAEDAEERARIARRRWRRIGRWVLPILCFVVLIAAWDRTVVVREIPQYLVPRPGDVIAALVEDWPSLYASFLITLTITLKGLVLAVAGGVGLAVIFTLSRPAELTLFPYAVLLQVTPAVAITPLLMIYLETSSIVLVIAFIVAFFPILSNTSLGLQSADHNLRDLFAVYRASQWQRLFILQFPAALPFFLGGLRIAGGLALIGAVVAEFATGTGGRGSGLAFRILESNYRLQVPRLYAALLLIILTGLAIFLVFTLLQHLLLRKWHESAVKREE